MWVKMSVYFEHLAATFFLEDAQFCQSSDILTAGKIQAKLLQSIYFVHLSISLIGVQYADKNIFIKPA